MGGADTSKFRRKLEVMTNSPFGRGRPNGTGGAPVLPRGRRLLTWKLDEHAQAKALRLQGQPHREFSSVVAKAELVKIFTRIMVWANCRSSVPEV